MNTMLEQCQAKLEQERKIIINCLAAPDPDAENSTFDSNEQQVTRLMESKLRSVDRALQRLRLDEERFGICQECRRPIGAERLKALPNAELCIDCQRQMERATGRSYRPRA